MSPDSRRSHVYIDGVRFVVVKGAPVFELAGVEPSREREREREQYYNLPPYSLVL